MRLPSQTVRQSTKRPVSGALSRRTAAASSTGSSTVRQSCPRRALVQSDPFGHLVVGDDGGGQVDTLIPALRQTLGENALARPSAAEHQGHAGVCRRRAHGLTVRVKRSSSACGNAIASSSDMWTIILHSERTEKKCAVRFGTDGKRHQATVSLSVQNDSEVPNPPVPLSRLCQNPIRERQRPPKSSFPRKRESRRGEAGKRRVGTLQDPWIPAFAGMTEGDGNDGEAFRAPKLGF